MSLLNKIRNSSNALQSENTYVALCFKMMEQLHRNWFLVANPNDSNATVLERNYIISLIFLMGKDSHDSSFGINVFPSGDINKEIRSHEAAKTTYERLYLKEIQGEKIHFIPDLVIHTSHNPNAINAGSQYVALEAKTTNNLSAKSFKKDFFKLNAYLKYLNFQHTIYLIVNSKKEKIESWLKKYISDRYFICNDKIDNIYFFIQEDKDSEPIAYKLNNERINEIRMQRNEIRR